MRLVVDAPDLTDLPDIASRVETSPAPVFTVGDVVYADDGVEGYGVVEHIHHDCLLVRHFPTRDAQHLHPVSHAKADCTVVYCPPTRDRFNADKHGKKIRLGNLIDADMGTLERVEAIIDGAIISRSISGNREKCSAWFAADVELATEF